MMNEKYQFYKSWMSPSGKADFVSIIIYAAAGSYLLLRGYTLIGILSIILAFLIYKKFLEIPLMITINDFEVSISHRRISWDDIKNVNFKIDGIRVLTNQVIEITISDERKISIKPRYYNENFLVRKVFEDMVLRKGISLIVRDRGSNTKSI